MAGGEGVGMEGGKQATDKDFSSFFLFFFLHQLATAETNVSCGTRQAGGGGVRGRGEGVVCLKSKVWFPHKPTSRCLS